MNCPYCAEGIKDEAIVCPNCRRDLTFFKPIEEKLKSFDAELSALSECVNKMAAYLDRHQLGADSDGGTPAPPPGKKPTIPRMIGVAAIQFILMIAIGGIFLAIDKDITPQYLSPKYDPSFSQQQWQEIQQAYALVNQAQVETYRNRSAVLTKLALGSIFALPIALGFWIGLRWRGRNLKRYLLVGLICGLVDGVIVLSVVTWVAVSWNHYPGQITYALLLVAVDMSRCIFGFATGGLLGDWLERRKYPQLYSSGFSDLLRQARSNVEARIGWFARTTRGLGSVTTSVAPLIPLMGVVITSIFGYYAARAAQTAKEEKEKNKPAVVAPSTSVQAPSPARSPQ